MSAAIDPTAPQLAAPAYAARVGALRAELDARGLSVFASSHLTHVRYLTGFTGSNGGVLVSPTEVFLATDARYTTQAEQQAPAATLLIERDTLPAVIATQPTAGVIAVEGDHLTYSDFRRLADRFPGQRLEPVSGLVERLRVIKDEVELELLATAARIADSALTAVLDGGALRPGVTEAEVAARLEYEMRLRGATGASFETIVAAGVNGALPHHRPDSTVLRDGDLVTIDFGALYAGYASDCTRTVALGTPTAQARDLYETVRRAQLAGVAAIRPGAPLSGVDAAAREVIAEAGFGDYFVHAVGHGVGLDVHEEPRVSGVAQGALEIGSVITVEPGIYLPGVGGVRIEDTAVVTASGPEVLTAGHTTDLRSLPDAIG